MQCIVLQSGSSMQAQEHAAFRRRTRPLATPCSVIVSYASSTLPLSTTCPTILDSVLHDNLLNVASEGRTSSSSRSVTSLEIQSSVPKPLCHTFGWIGMPCAPTQSLVRARPGTVNGAKGVEGTDGAGGAATERPRLDADYCERAEIGGRHDADSVVGGDADPRRAERRRPEVSQVLRQQPLLRLTRVKEPGGASVSRRCAGDPLPREIGRARALRRHAAAHCLGCEVRVGPGAAAIRDQAGAVAGRVRASGVPSDRAQRRVGGGRGAAQLAGVGRRVLSSTGCLLYTSPSPRD